MDSNDIDPVDFGSACLYVSNNKLYIEYLDKSVSMDLNTEETTNLVKTLLSSGDFWANFMNSLSAGISKHK